MDKKLFVSKGIHKNRKMELNGKRSVTQEGGLFLTKKEQAMMCWTATERANKRRKIAWSIGGFCDVAYRVHHAILQSFACASFRPFYFHY